MEMIICLWGSAGRVKQKKGEGIKGDRETVGNAKTRGNRIPARALLTIKSDALHPSRMANGALQRLPTKRDVRHLYVFDKTGT
jgi:hypothetical protein